MTSRFTARRARRAVESFIRDNTGWTAPAIFESLESRRLLSTAQDITGLTALRADPNYSGVDGSGVGVAVIDTGTWAAHPDLEKNFVAFFDGVTNRYTANASTSVSSAFDPDGHGTHTAGTAVSRNPEIGVATAAKLVAIRGIPSGSDPVPQFDTVLNSLQWVAAHYQQFNIKVVNMSLGDYTTNFNVAPGGSKPAIFSELERLGITTVISSGNNYGNFASLGAASPGIYGTLTVANTWPDNGPTADFPSYGGNGDTIRYVAGENDAAPDRLAATSQRSTLPNQVAAPGEEILSTWNNPSKLYNRLSGTSMSAPFVSGMVALMQDAAFTYGGRYLTTGEVQSIVRSTGDAIVDSNVSTNFRVPVTFDSSGQVHRAGANQDLPETGQTFFRVNVYHAVQAVRNLVTSGTAVPEPAPSPAPTGDANDTTATAVVVPSLDATRQYQFTGNIGLDGEVQVGANDVDLFRVDLEARGVLTFATSAPAGGTSFDAYLRLFDSSSNQIAFADDTSGLYPTLQSVRLAAGRYYFGVSSFNNTAYTTTGSGAANGQSSGDYDLTVSLTNPDPNGVAAGATAVDLADPDTINPNTNLPANFFNGAIGSDPNPLDPGGARVQIGATDVDMFQVTAPDDGVLFIDTDAVSAGLPDAVDTYVRVFDSDLNQVAFNDDVNNTTTDSFLQLNVSAGDTFFVAVTTFDNRSFNPADPFDRTSTRNVTGSYRLYLYFGNGDADGTVFTARDATVGATISGDIGKDSGQPILGADDGDKDVDFHRYTASAAGLLEFTAADTDGVFSPVLTLWKFDAQNNSIERLRNTAGADARLITQVAAGDVYYVSVTGVGNNDFKWYAVASGSGGDTGGYTLQSTMRPSSDAALLINDSIQNATPETINSGDTLDRTLGDDGGLDRGAADVDLYRFTPAAGGQVVIRATAPGEAATDPFLRVFDANGAEITYNDDASDGTRDAAITLSVTAGRTYYIGVNGSGDNARGYNPVTGAGAAPASAEGDYVLSVGAVQPPGGGPGEPSSQRAILFDAQTRAVYTDSDGGIVQITLKGLGSGTLLFDRDGNADASSLVLDGVAAGSTLSIKGVTSFGDVTINGSLKAFGSRTLDLRGRLNVSGSLPKLQLNSVSGATINVAGSAPTTIAFAQVSDSSMTFAGAVKSMKLSAWTDTTADSAADALTAPSIASLTAVGEFGASLNVGSIGKMKVGSLVGSDVRAASLIASLTANSISGSRVFAGVAIGLTALPDALDDFTSGSASIKSISIKGRSLTSVVDSLFAAPVIGKASLGGVATDDGGATLGVAADRIASIRGISSLGPISAARLEDPSDSTQLGDFVIRLL